jgi:DNA ligase-1
MHLLWNGQFRLRTFIAGDRRDMALFAAVAELAEELAGESGRLKKRAAIARAIAAVHAATPESEDAGWFALYLAGLPFAEADARKLNAGGALLTKALLTVSGATDAALTAAYRRHGDLGAAAFDLLGAGGAPVESGSGSGLTLAEVADAFAGMAVAKTTAIRSALVQGMLRRATPLEVKYLLKLMLGDMRIGVKQSLVEEAIAVAAGAPVEAVRHAVMLEADLASAVRRAFTGTLPEARMRLFHPLGFMLASPVETPEEAVERFTEKPPKAGARKKVAKEKKPKRGEKAKQSLRRALEHDTERETEASVAMEAESEGHSAASVPQAVDVDAEEFPDAPALDVIGAGDSENEEQRSIAVSDVREVEAFLEDKYDGMRAQVHCGDAGQPGRVAIYSRNREDVTASFPELEEAFARVRPEPDGPLIFDGEILGWDLATARALPFAVLGTRIGRKKVSNEMRGQVPVVFMAFDLMYGGGELLLELPLRERRNRLEAVVEALVGRVVSPVVLDERVRNSQAVLFSGAESAGAAAEKSVERLMISPSRLVESAEDIDRAYADARARANEGVMLKAAGSVYQPGRRGLAWVKLKRELATLDVVVTGAEFGHGKRAGILSDYTFAVRDGDGKLLNVGKAYSGLTDAEIAEMSAWMMEHTLEDQGFFRTVEPLMVLEVAFNNIMRSGRHASGFAMRFPRILRIRTDKPVNEIDTVERVEEIYQSQVDKPTE